MLEISRDHLGMLVGESVNQQAGNNGGTFGGVHGCISDA
jgi:hypothetical protein